MNIPQTLRRSFVENPIHWILGGLLALSVYSHYKTAVEFTSVCEAIVRLNEGYFDFETAQRYEPTGIDFHAVVARAEEHEQLMQANKADGRAYRWWRKEAGYLVRACGDKLAGPDPRDDN